MPKIEESGVSQLIKKGYSKSEATAIIRGTLIKSGILDKHGKLTKVGRARNLMSKARRDKESVLETKKRLKKGGK